MRVHKRLRDVVNTSIENRTPPMGEPNATATPAALAAVMISRVLPIENNKQEIYNDGNDSYFGYV